MELEPTILLCNICNYRSRVGYICKSYLRKMQDKHFKSRRHANNVIKFNNLKSKENNLPTLYNTEIMDEVKNEEPMIFTMDSDVTDEESEPEDIDKLPTVVHGPNLMGKYNEDDLPLKIRLERYKNNHPDIQDYHAKFWRVPMKERCPSYFEADEDGNLEPLYACDLVKYYENGWFDKNDKYGTVLLLLLERAGIRFWD